MTPPTVAIRVDASARIGLGHLMRCLTLADALRAEGARPVFITADLGAPSARVIASRGHEALALPAAPDVRQSADQPWDDRTSDDDAAATCRALQAGPRFDWVIVDHYGLDARWEAKVAAVADRVGVIDDLGNRPHACELLVDQNLSSPVHARYPALTPGRCCHLLGPDFALLRAEFSRLRAALPREARPLRRVIVGFGGSDPTGETEKALAAFGRLAEPALRLDVVIGAANVRGAAIRDAAEADERVTVYEDTERMADLMARADLAIGAGGGTTWERCCLGLPALVITVAENQRAIAEAGDEAGVLCHLGPSERVAAGDIERELRAAMDDPRPLFEIGRRAFALVDGLGAGRVASAMMGAASGARWA